MAAVMCNEVSAQGQEMSGAQTVRHEPPSTALLAPAKSILSNQRKTPHSSPTNLPLGPRASVTLFEVLLDPVP